MKTKNSSSISPKSDQNDIDYDQSTQKNVLSNKKQHLCLSTSSSSSSSFTSHQANQLNTPTISKK
ncbi:hypothetical protein KSF78_0006930 [Schistosoma japonicum]|nr:hypothetical protein KSF78_0006930 [Schistosoma japonicum]